MQLQLQVVLTFVVTTLFFLNLAILLPLLISHPSMEEDLVKLIRYSHHRHSREQEEQIIYLHGLTAAAQARGETQ